MKYTYKTKKAATKAQGYWGKGRGRSSVGKSKRGGYTLWISPKNPKLR